VARQSNHKIQAVWLLAWLVSNLPSTQIGHFMTGCLGRGYANPWQHVITPSKVPHSPQAVTRFTRSKILQQITVNDIWLYSRVSQQRYTHQQEKIKTTVKCSHEVKWRRTLSRKKSKSSSIPPQTTIVIGRHVGHRLICRSNYYCSRQRLGHRPICKSKVFCWGAAIVSFRASTNI